MAAVRRQRVGRRLARWATPSASSRQVDVGNRTRRPRQLVQVVVRGAIQHMVESVPRTVIRGRVTGRQRRTRYGPRQIVPADRRGIGTGGPESVEMPVNTAVDDVLLSGWGDVRAGFTRRPRRPARKGQVVVADRTKRAVQP